MMSKMAAATTEPACWIGIGYALALRTRAISYRLVERVTP
jgi:hypothetical protein